MLRRLLHFAVVMGCVLLISPIPLAAQDTTPPELTALDFTPKTIDTTLTPATVTVTATATDDISGVSVIMVRFRSPSEMQQRAGAINCSPDTPCPPFVDITFLRFGEPGIWTVSSVEIWDVVGNYRIYDTTALSARGLPTQLTVLSIQDVNPSELTALDFTPKTIDTTLTPATVTVTATATDDISGVSGIMVRFRSPSGIQQRAGAINCSPDTPCPPSVEITFLRVRGTRNLDRLLCRDLGCSWELSDSTTPLRCRRGGSLHN